MENEKNKDGLWGELTKSSGEYFSPEPNVPYQIQISGATLSESEKYKKDDGTPKLKISVQLTTINGQAVKKTLESGSFTIMREIRQYKDDPKLGTYMFFLLKEKDGEKTKYTFKKMGEVKSSSSSFGTEAYI